MRNLARVQCEDSKCRVRLGRRILFKLDIDRLSIVVQRYIMRTQRDNDSGIVGFDEFLRFFFDLARYS